jgi:hypothetical protein
MDRACTLSPKPTAFGSASSRSPAISMSRPEPRNSGRPVVAKSPMMRYTIARHASTRITVALMLMSAAVLLRPLGRTQPTTAREAGAYRTTRRAAQELGVTHHALLDGQRHHDAPIPS